MAGKLLFIFALIGLFAFSLCEAQGDISGDFNFGGYNDPSRALQGERQMRPVLQRHTVTIDMLNVTAEQRTWLRIEFTTRGFPRLRLSRYVLSNATAPSNGTAPNDNSTTNGTNPVPPCDPNNSIPCNVTTNNTVTDLVTPFCANLTFLCNGTALPDPCSVFNSSIACNLTSELVSPCNGSFPCVITNSSFCNSNLTVVCLPPVPPPSNNTDNNNTIPCDPTNPLLNCNGTNSNVTITGFTFRVGLRRVIEFLPDDDSNNSNNSSTNETAPISNASNVCYANETAISQFSLVGYSSSWTPLVLHLTTVSSNNVTANVTKYCSSLTHSGATFSICLSVADIPVFDSQNHSVGPSRVKIEISLSNYRFSRSKSKLALMGFVSSMSVASESVNMPRLILFNQDGALDWDGIVNTEKGPMEVQASSLSDLATVTRGEIDGGDGFDDDPLRFTEMSAGVAFCINNQTHARNYTWDSSAEINDLSNLDGSNLQSSATSVFAATFAFVAAFLAVALQQLF